MELSQQQRRLALTNKLMPRTTYREYTYWYVQNFGLAGVHTVICACFRSRRAYQDRNCAKLNEVALESNIWRSKLIPRGSQILFGMLIVRR